MREHSCLPSEANMFFAVEEALQPEHPVCVADPWYDKE